MALMNSADVLAIADKVGRKYFFLREAAISGAQIGSDTYYDYCHVCPDGDPEIEIPTLSVARNSDNNWQDSTIETITNGLISSTTSSFTVIGGITNHFSTAGLTGGWNQYLEQTPNTVNPTFPGDNLGVRVSESFRRIYSLAGGGAQLRSRNVFYDDFDPFVFASVEVLDAGTGTVDYTDGGDFGLQSTTDLADGTKFAATMLQVMPVGNGGSIGGTDIDIEIDAKDADDNPVTIPFTIPAGSPDNVALLVGSSQTERYINVTNVTLPGSSNGTTGDKFEIQNVSERVVQL